MMTRKSWDRDQECSGTAYYSNPSSAANSGETSFEPEPEGADVILLGRGVNIRSTVRPELDAGARAMQDMQEC